MGQATYRDATIGDAAVLAELFARSFTETFGHLYCRSDLDAFLSRFDEPWFRRELADPAFAMRIAEVGQAAVGFAKVGPLQLPVEARGPSVELRQLYVLRSWQGAGLARELMGWVLAEAQRRHARDLYLTVFVDNHRARRFYDGYGFEFVGPYRFMVGKHADEDHIMRLALAAE
jgi:GNAT superfamily N-acetyltransferase